MVGRQLNDSLAVRITDSQDRPVKSQKIVFGVIAGGASAELLPDTVLTDADGIARSAWVLGGVAGEQRVEARVVSRNGLSAEFAATAQAEAADTLYAVEGQDQTGIVRGKLTDSLVVLVTDRFGNPLGNQSIEWRVPSGEGTVSSPLVSTGAAGRAAVARILGPGAGAQSARASLSTLTGQVVVFRHTAVSGHAVDLVRLSPDNQTAPSGSRLADPVVVQAQDAEGNGVPRETITWVPSSGGSVSPRSSVTDAEGKASTTWTLASAAGANTLTAAGFGATIQFHATGSSRAPETITPLSPTSFTGTAGQPVATGQRPSVRVSDSQGNPVQGVSVSFTVAQGGGAISDASGSGNQVFIPTGSDGTATVSGWTLGSTSETNVVMARASRAGGSELGGSPVSFTATAQAGSAARIVFGQQPRSSSAGSSIAPPVTVIIQDQNGNPVTSSTATVTLGLSNNPGSGTLSGTRSGTPVNGVVQFADLSIDRSGSGYTLVAHSTGVPDVFSAAFDIQAAAAAHLAFLTQPSNVAAGAFIAPPLQVAIQDPNGNTVSSAGDSIRLSLNPASGNLGGTVAVKAVNGVATLGQVSVGGAGYGYTLTAIAPYAPLISATSSAFNVVSNQPPALHLVFTAQPTDVGRGEDFRPKVRVSVYDSNGDLVDSARNTISVRLGNNPLGLATLSGDPVKDAKNGMAEFGNIKVNGLTLFNNLTLIASSPGMPDVSSNSFNVR